MELKENISWQKHLRYIYIIYIPYAPIPSASGLGVGFRYLNTEPHRVFGALDKQILVHGRFSMSTGWMVSIKDATSEKKYGGLEGDFFLLITQLGKCFLGAAVSF